MDEPPVTPPVDSAAAAWTTWERWRTRSRDGWRRLIFPGLFLVYLAQTVGGVANRAHGAGAVAGYVLIAVFCGLYLWALPVSWRKGYGAHFWGLVGVLTAIYVAESFFAESDAYVMAIFVVVLFVVSVPRFWWLIALFFTVTAAYLPLFIPSWDMGVNYSAAFAIPVTAAAMFGFFRVLQSNHDLAEARSEVARLAAENERARIARDLHDLLGHSLTTITVKASLANRLAERQPERAAAEIAQVEQLARSALSEVRSAITGYRGVSLAGEVASSREVLRAAGVTPVFPTAVDVVRPGHHELFAWVVREGVTNVVRHAHAMTCTLELGTDSVAITDDGVGPRGPACDGNGLRGLRERVAAAGGEVDAGPIDGHGWSLRVDLPIQEVELPTPEPAAR